VAQQVLYRDVVADQREVTAEDRAGAGGEVEHAGVDQRHDRERGQALGAACEPQLRRDGVRDPMRPVGQAEGLGELHLAAALDVDDAREARAPG
jgi:hypothetical protein